MSNKDLARLFHDTYEKLAPLFDYETRTDTREFDPDSRNGQLMIAVCAHVRAALAARSVPGEASELVERLRRVSDQFTCHPASRGIADCEEAGELMRAAAAALAASPVPAGWLPIDSAPKLKKIVVAYRNSAGKWRRVLATYWPAETLESDHSNSGWADEGWYEATEAYEELAPLEGDPVCWSELPPINDASAPAPTTPTGLTKSAASVPAPAQAVIAWVRQHPDGTLTDEILPDATIEPVRKSSGAWLPLSLSAPVSAPAQQAEASLDQNELYRLQMAAISTAAFGYWKLGDPIKDEYVTVALKDVASLYEKYDALFKAAAAPAPSVEAQIALLMDASPEKVDEHLAALGLDPKDIEKRGMRAVEGALAALKEHDNG